MQKHLPLLKETLQFMVQQLRSDDKLCIITFDHEVSSSPSLPSRHTHVMLQIMLCSDAQKMHQSCFVF